MKKLKLRLTHLWYKLLMKLGLKSDEVYYIGGSEALPPPLSKDEEQVLLMKLPNGDQAARAILIERNLRLVVYIARKFENTGINIEDLISIGTIGLIKAVNTFNPEKKIKLASDRYGCHTILWIFSNKPCGKRNRKRLNSFRPQPIFK